MLAALAVAAILAVAAPSEPSTVPRELRLRMVEEINRDRVAAGLRPVELSDQLSRAADQHCREMVLERYTSHWNRAGLKPYVRYALAGIRDFTAENIWSQSGRDILPSLDAVLPDMLLGHRRFMQETPPNDGHRRAILTPSHTHVGIGVAWTRHEMRLIEVFAFRRAELESLPQRATLQTTLAIRGRVSASGYRLHAISVFYEPLPAAMTNEQLQATYDYGLPDEEWIEKPRLFPGARYTDGSTGTITEDSNGEFRVPLTLWKSQPGIYTVAVWVRGGREDPVIGAMTSIIISAAGGTEGASPLLLPASAVAGPFPGAP